MSEKDDHSPEDSITETISILKDSIKIDESHDTQILLINESKEISLDDKRVESEVQVEEEEEEEEEKPKAIKFKTNFSYGYNSDGDDDDDEVRTDDLNHLEPKLRDAWIEMRKLDKILKTATDKEKRIKRETRQLIEKNRIELELIKMTSDRKETKQEQENTQNFLALSYNETNSNDKKFLNDEDCDDDDDDSSLFNTLSPVFQTQLPDQNESNKESQFTKENHEDRKSSLPSESVSKLDSQTSTMTTTTSTTKQLFRIANNKDKNFIKRNIELAQDTGGTLALTEEEKKRLNELLEEDDLNEKEIQYEKDEHSENINEVVTYNPSEIVLMPGEGFKPNMSELERLLEIDSKLERRNTSSLVTRVTSRQSGIDLNSIRGGQQQSYTIDSQSYRSLLSLENRKIMLNDDFDENTFGDRFIRETRQTREEQQRLKQIDKQLEDLKASKSFTNDENNDTQSSLSESRVVESKISLIDEYTLQNLLDECSLENKKVVSLINNFKLATVREEEASEQQVQDDNPDTASLNDDIQLTEETLRVLLEQAKHEGIVGDDTTFTKQEEDIERSLYEEALEILKQNPTSSFLNQSFECDDNEMKSSLPRIPSSIITSRSNSVMSTSQSLNESSTIKLPKIESRFIPKEFF